MPMTQFEWNFVWLLILLLVVFFFWTESIEESRVLDRREIDGHLDDLHRRLDAMQVSYENISHHWVAAEFEATAYTLACGNGDGRTATGTLPIPGRTLAVDPAVIPLGSPVWVDGFGWMVAEDTGGAIRGNMLDIYFEELREARQFGRQTVKVIHWRGG